MPVTVVASAASATAGVSASNTRGAVIVANDDANRLYVLLGVGTVSTSLYSFSLAQNESAMVETRAKVSLIWSADGSGNAMITEIGRDGSV